MQSDQNQGGRPSNDKIDARRKKVREFMFQNVSYVEMAKALDCSQKTIREDIAYWKKYYSALAMNNPELAREQMSRVNQVLDEIDIVKREYWAAYNNLMAKMSENEQILKQWRENLDMIRKEYEVAVAQNNGKEKRRLESILKTLSKPPHLPSYYSTRLDTLKLILDRIDKEAKLLNMFNPSEQLPKNFITMDVFKKVMLVFKDIITEMIPVEQRRYAFERLRRVKIHDIQATDIVEAEIVQEQAIGFNRVQPEDNQTVTDEHDHPTPPLTPKEPVEKEEDDDKPGDLTDLEI